MLPCNMEKFDFNAPINATVVFDDSDDETKPSLDDLEIKVENKELKIKQKDVITNCPTTTSSIKAVENENRSMLSTPKTFEVQQVVKYTASKFESLKPCTSKERFLDMPSLQEENVNLQSCINEQDNNGQIRATISKKQNKIQEIDSERRIGEKETKKDQESQRPLKRKRVTNIQKITKRRVTKEITSRDTNIAEIQNYKSDRIITNQNNLQSCSQPNTECSQKQNDNRKEHCKDNTEIYQNSIDVFNQQQLANKSKQNAYQTCYQAQPNTEYSQKQNDNKKEHCKDNTEIHQNSFDVFNQQQLTNKSKQKAYQTWYPAQPDTECSQKQNDNRKEHCKDNTEIHQNSFDVFNQQQLANNSKQNPLQTCYQAQPNTECSQKQNDNRKEHCKDNTETNLNSFDDYNQQQLANKNKQNALQSCNQAQPNTKCSQKQNDNRKEHCTDNIEINQNSIDDFNQQELYRNILAYKIKQKAHQSCYQAQPNTECSQTQNNHRKEHCTKNTDINQNSIGDFDKQQTNTHISEYQLLNEINETAMAANYVKQSLYTISEHMIYIINAFHNYTRIKNNKSCIIHKSCNNKSCIDARIQHELNNFIRTRNHFFDLSYSPVLNIIIPRENDTTFVKSFVNSTIEMAHSKSYKYRHEHIVPLYLEMIEWVKIKKESIMKRMNTYKVGAPVLMEHLLTPAQQNKAPPPYHQQFHKTSTESNKSISVTVPQGLNLSIAPTYSKIQNVHRETCCPVVMPPPNTQVYYNQMFNNTQAMQNTTQRLNESLQKLHNFVGNLQPQQNFNNIQNVAPSLDKPMPELWQKQATNSWQNGAPQSFLQNHQECGLSQNNQYFPPENPTQNELNRSSISRDSGFMSPLNFNTSNDHSFNLQEEQRVQPGRQPTPLITHVTSLNPNVSYIVDGFCIVCGKTTKKKCLGCYKCYYCSHDCQYSDWKNHMGVCTSRG